MVMEVNASSPCAVQLVGFSLIRPGFSVIALRVSLGDAAAAAAASG
jgi:hypothetical protein